MALRNDPCWNDDGTFNSEAYHAEQARIPRREEVGVDSVWEIDDSKFAGVWKVTKILPRNYDLVNPRGQKLRCSIDGLRRTDKQFVKVENFFKPYTGAVVTTTARGVPDGPLVVFQLVGLDEAKVTLLNQDNGRYWKVPVALLRKFTGTITL